MTDYDTRLKDCRSGGQIMRTASRIVALGRADFDGVGEVFGFATERHSRESCVGERGELHVS